MNGMPIREVLAMPRSWHRRCVQMLTNDDNDTGQPKSGFTMTEGFRDR